MMIPDSVALRHNAQRFVSMPIWYDNEQRNFGYNPDIARMPLHGYSSSVFCALQFAFYTNPKKIYLYGCDTSDAGHAYGANKKITSDNILLMKKEWNIIKKIAPVFYPETEIISVNPVGLKGMFHDVYTKSYLQDHPEIDIQKVEILE